MALPKGKVKIRWNSNFAYVIGLLVTDGSLSKDGRHIDFTSKDLELMNHLNKSLGTNYKPSKKSRSNEKEKKYYRIQIGDILFYKFLTELGLTQNKTRTIKAVKIPKKYFFDFLRGHLDGDGYFYSYYDPRWRASLMYYLVFCSASLQHIKWLQSQIEHMVGIHGHITKSHSVFLLKYAKTESEILIKKLYYSPKILYLKRKYLKIFRTLSII